MLDDSPLTPDDFAVTEILGEAASHTSERDELRPPDGSLLADVLAKAALVTGVMTGLSGLVPLLLGAVALLCGSTHLLQSAVGLTIPGLIGLFCFGLAYKLVKSSRRAPPWGVPLLVAPACLILGLGIVKWVEFASKCFP